MTWSVLGRGSFFAGASDPRDVDVLVLTDEDLSRRDAACRVRHLVDENLPLDIAVIHPDHLDTEVVARAAIHAGVLLDGDDPRPEVAGVTWPEWALGMLIWTHLARESNPTAAALAAVRGILATERHEIVAALSKYLVPDAAAGTPWADLAEAAWQWRGPVPFTHPDLDAAIAALHRGLAGDTTDHHGEIVATVYRGVFTADRLKNVAALPTHAPQDGGRHKGPLADTLVGEQMALVAEIANSSIWRWPLGDGEPFAVHRYWPGDEFPLHVDRHEHISPVMRRAAAGADLSRLASRAHNVVTMVRPADEGGVLRLRLDGAMVPFDLGVGDVAVFDGAIAHEVTPVEAGERVVVVTHTHREPK